MENKYKRTEEDDDWVGCIYVQDVLRILNSSLDESWQLLLRLMLHSSSKLNPRLRTAEVETWQQEASFIVIDWRNRHRFYEQGMSHQALCITYTRLYFIMLQYFCTPSNIDPVFQFSKPSVLEPGKTLLRALLRHNEMRRNNFIALGGIKFSCMED